MTARYLLDTNILSDLVRHPQGVIAQRIIAEGQETVVTSIVVAAELRFGAVKKGSARLITQVDTILAAMTIVPIERPMDTTYGKLRLELETAGRPIGGNDLLIASQALTLDLAVVTANLREYERVPGLAVENWL